MKSAKRPAAKKTATRASSRSTPMQKTLYLKKDEMALWDKLSADVREGWEINEETLNSYESDEDLAIRAEMLQKEMSMPSKAKLLEKLVEVGEGVPQDVIMTAVFTIGARGLDEFVKTVLTNTEADADVEGAANLSLLRHMLLEANAE